jgi:hypothetical protein
MDRTNLNIRITRESARCSGALQEHRTKRLNWPTLPRRRRHYICRDYLQRARRARCYQGAGAARRPIHVGAGTVLAPQQAERAIGAGAEFVVSPSLELNLIRLCHTANIACFPGAATPTEIIAAQRAHADLGQNLSRRSGRRAVFHPTDAGAFP